MDLGNAGLKDFLRDYVLALREAPMYIPLLASIDFFGGGAESMLRLYARGYALSFRDCGRMSLKPREEGSGVIVTLAEIPEACRREAYAYAHLGGVEGGVGLAKARADVRLDASDFANGRVVFEATELID